MISKDDIRKALEEGRVSIGCPIPEGMKPLRKQDVEYIQRVMQDIIEREKKDV